MKETSELINTAVDTVVQGIESFKDGAQLTDIGDFFDEVVQWGPAVRGLAEGFPAEAMATTPEDIENLFEVQRPKLVEAGVNPLLVGAIVSGLKGIYYSYAAILQSGQEVLTVK